MTTVVLFLGILSAYAPGPSRAQIAYQQQHGNIPLDLGAYDAMIAVDDCSLIGHEATIYAGHETFTAIVFDCAGANGAHLFSDGNDESTPHKYAGEVDYNFWKLRPDIVGTLVRIRVDMNEKYKGHPALQPEIVEPAEPISILDAALLAIAEDNSKPCHLTPTQAASLTEYIRSLEQHVIRLADVNKHRAKLEHELIKLANMSKPSPASFRNWVE